MWQCKLQPHSGRKVGEKLTTKKNRKEELARWNGCGKGITGAFNDVQAMFIMMK